MAHEGQGDRAVLHFNHVGEDLAGTTRLTQVPGADHSEITTIKYNSEKGWLNIRSWALPSRRGFGSSFGEAVGLNGTAIVRLEPAGAKPAAVRYGWRIAAVVNAGLLAEIR